MLSDAQKLAEARKLAALLSAHGHSNARERILEILNNAMPDAARMAMLRYEAAVITHELPPGHHLGRRLRIFLEE